MRNLVRQCSSHSGQFPSAAGLAGLGMAFAAFSSGVHSYPISRYVLVEADEQMCQLSAHGRAVVQRPLYAPAMPVAWKRSLDSRDSAFAHGRGG